MMVLRCSSSFPDIHGLVKAASALGDVLVLAPKAVKTGKALEMAFFLARDAFEGKENISSKLSNEAMLFLSCEINFESALRKAGAVSPDDFVLVSEKAIPSSRLKKTLKLVRCQSLVLSEWGNEKGAYSEGELAIEKMALARIRN